MSDEIDTLRALLLAQAHRLLSAHFIGNAPPAVERERAEMYAPVVGDYVFVLHAGDAPHRRCVGILQSVHLYSSANDSPIDFTIQLLDGRTQHWENAQAVKLFTSLYDGTPSIIPEARPVQQTPALPSSTVGR